MVKKAFDVMRNITILNSFTFAFMSGIGSIILLEKGLDLSLLGLYIMISSGSVILLEIPTGAFADAYGRKNAIMLGFLFHAIFLAGLILFPSVSTIMILAVVGAVGISMMSGAKEAYAVDLLPKQQKVRYTHMLLSSGLGWQHSTFFLGAIIGGYFATFSIDYALLIGLPFAVVGLLYSWFGLKEKEPKLDFVRAEKGIISNMSNALKHSIASIPLRTIFLLGLLLGMAAFGLFNYWQPIMREIGNWDTSNMGLFFAFMSIMVIIGSKISPYLKSDWNTIILLTLGLSVFLFVAAVVAPPLVIAALILLWNLLLGINGPIGGAIINRNTSSEIRATVLSLGSMFVRIGMVLFGILVFFMGTDEPRLFWLAGSLFLLLGAIIVLFSRKKLFLGEESVLKGEMN